ncbi:MAG: TIGR03936 family radical SAM-associated protein [Spirochaetia bacterium]|jgi:radical SAM-linked protein|nr:TIGR03936 family radical SAM-associated protein [Spirochaetia bacterium]
MHLSDKLSALLRRAENPARYAGGEFGMRVKDAALRCAVSFPDLYEIGMSNQAVAILYGMLNSLENVSCERVFCPAQDFEELLKNAGIPLYGLESGRPLFAFDIVAFSLGYELTATNILTILDRGGIPLRAGDRSGGDPVVIAGGPAATNPLPFGAVFDAVYIGEAEAEFRLVAEELAAMKTRGASRAGLLDRIRQSPSFWHAGKSSPARRSVWTGFSDSLSHALCGPVSSLRTVQDHGVVEIMRGCPQGCRFCHAGVYYKPFRMKKRENIYEEVCKLIHISGYREITLSSLSSGDYTDIARLIKELNSLHRKRKVSFALPSLHLESFGLEILTAISEVRKSGLTFAVETPRPEFQLGLNKQASRDKIIEILKEARLRGWKLAKFYFMVGLPFYGDRGQEAADIVDFVRSVHAETRMGLNVNIGTFIPKAHTPYQWAAQLTESEALESITRIKRGLQSACIKVGYHAPFQSYLEGVFSRGDNRVGELLFEAWGRGARFDAWEDRCRPEPWREVLAEARWDVEDATCRPRPPGDRLPWENAVSLGTGAAYFKNEWMRHGEYVPTSPCAAPCPHPCGVCGESVFPVAAPSVDETPDESLEAKSLQAEPFAGPRAIYRHICRYEKTGAAAFLPHLSLMQVMERGLLRAGITPRFTGGFNPKPVLEFAQPSSVGVESLEEIFSFETYDAPVGHGCLAGAVNASLPQGLSVKDVSCLRYWEKGKKPPSLMSLSAGGRYELSSENQPLLSGLAEAFKSLDGVTMLEETGQTLTLDYIAGENGKGFQAVLKNLTDSPGELSVRKKNSYARCRGRIMSYAAAVDELRKDNW